HVAPRAGDHDPPLTISIPCDRPHCEAAWLAGVHVDEREPRRLRREFAARDKLPLFFGTVDKRCARLPGAPLGVAGVGFVGPRVLDGSPVVGDWKSTRLNSSHCPSSY